MTGRPGFRGARIGRVLAVLAAAAVGLALAPDAAAQGFRIQEGGPSLGNAGAGSAATAEDPTTAFFNPAGMTGIRGDRGALLLNFVRTDLRFRDDGSTDRTDGEMRGGDGRNAGGLAFLPSLYAVLDRGDTWFGIGVNHPFGLSTDYGDDWVGRYHATRSSLTVTQVNPSVAWRLHDEFSFGLGLDLQQARATLENAIDFGSIAVDELGPGPAAALGLAPQRDDGKATLSGSSFGVGANAGILWLPREDTRVGLAWRSAVKHGLEGRARFAVPRDARQLTAAGDFRDTDARVDITLPATLLLGAVHDLTPRWSLLGGLEWNDWSQFRELKIDLRDSRAGNLRQQQGWHDTLRSMAGVSWRPDARWTLRAGGSYDSSPVGRDERRPRLPDAARTTVAFGAGLRLSSRAALDLSYARFWTRTVPLDVADPDVGRLRGETRSRGDYVSLSVTVDL